MKCQHGKEIVVLIVTSSKDYWDDGIELLDENGTVDNKGIYIEVNCPLCRLVKTDIRF